MTELPNLNFFGPSGWRCPQCGRIYSPSTIMCYYCNNQQTYVSGHTTGTPIKEYVQNWNDYLNNHTTNPISKTEQEYRTDCGQTVTIKDGMPQVTITANDCNTASSITSEWNKLISQTTNIFDYPDVDKILNPTNIIDNKDMFQVHFDKTVTYEV